MTLDIAVVGTGDAPDEPDQEGFAMAYRHAAGYRRLEDCQLVACADIVPENAERFASRYDLDGVYEDYETMLADADPDVVSVTVPPGVHAEIVTGCARTGDLDAIHCEKPMATTWADCREMVEVCEAEGVQLTINHQRRVGPTYVRARELLETGAIGDLARVEISAKNLFDAGTHVFHLAGYYTDWARPEWVISQLDYRTEDRWFGAHNENQAVTQWRCADGVTGLAATGEGRDGIGCYVRLVGTDGRIEVGVDDGPALRMRRGRTFGWKQIHTGENMWGDTVLPTWKAALAKGARMVPGLPSDSYSGPSHIERAIESVVASVRTGEPCPLRADRALQSTELIFASWESARRRGRVDLPLEIEDNPLDDMVERGLIPVGREDGSGGSADTPAEPQARTNDD